MLAPMPPVLLLLALPSPVQADAPAPPDLFALRSRMERSGPQPASSQPASSQPASSQPAPPWAPPPGAARGWDVTHYDLALQVDPTSRTVQGQTALTATVGAGGDLVLNADGPIIDQVQVDGVDATWSQDGSQVHIDTTGAGSSLSATVVFHDRAGSTGRGGLGLDWGPPVASMHEPSGARLWLVLVDEPDDKASWTFHTTVPEGWQVVHNGVLVSTEAADPGWTTWTYELEQPISSYLVVLDAGDLATWTDPRAKDGSLVESEVVAAPDRLDAAVADLGNTADIIDQYGQWWAPYVWPLYRNVVFPFSGGMEHTTATSFGQDMIGTSSAEIVNAHEISHHWWGDLVTCADWDEIWLNEGLASHAELRWYEAQYGEDGRQAYFEAQRDSYLRWKAYEGVFSLVAPNFMWGGTVYDKGSLVMEMLRLQVGADAFDASLRRYEDEHAFDVVTTGDLQAAFEETTGQDWGWYFDQWAYQADDPSLQVGMEQRALAGGGVQVDLHLAQVNEAGSWRIPVPWRLRLADGSSQEGETWIEQDGPALTSLCLDAAPGELEIDPHAHLLFDGLDRDDTAFASAPAACGRAFAEGGSAGDTGLGAAGGTWSGGQTSCSVTPRPRGLLLALLLALPGLLLRRRSRG